MPTRIARGVDQTVYFDEGELSVSAFDPRLLMAHDREKLFVRPVGERTFSVNATHKAVVGDQLTLRVSDGATTKDFEFVVVG